MRVYLNWVVIVVLNLVFALYLANCGGVIDIPSLSLAAGTVTTTTIQSGSTAVTLTSGVADVDLATVINYTFSSAIDTSTVTGNTFFVVPVAADTDVSVVMKDVSSVCNPNDSNKIQATPSCSSNTECTLTLPSLTQCYEYAICMINVKDSAGSAITDSMKYFHSVCCSTKYAAESCDYTADVSPTDTTKFKYDDITTIFVNAGTPLNTTQEDCLCTEAISAGAEDCISGAILTSSTQACGFEMPSEQQSPSSSCGSYVPSGVCPTQNVLINTNCSNITDETTCNNSYEYNAEISTGPLAGTVGNWACYWAELDTGEGCGCIYDNRAQCTGGQD